ncbi:MAG: PDZ domain-containing protein [Alphaproteobacteria bacterium]|nr:PDZ domain-containing protein [Alphaproteobacteria bacterium]MCB9684302.1 PDZ domain-containing protein [Alphaproteobacteria bacterium]
MRGLATLGMLVCVTLAGCDKEQPEPAAAHAPARAKPKPTPAPAPSAAPAPAPTPAPGTVVRRPHPQPAPGTAPAPGSSPGTSPGTSPGAPPATTPPGQGEPTAGTPGAQPPAPGAPSAGRGKQPSPAPSGITQVSSTKWTVSRSLANRWMDDPYSLGNARESGAGWQLMGIKTRDAYHLGMRNGDIVLEANGHKLNTKPQLLAAYLDLKNDTVFNVTFLRNGQRMTHTYQIVN